MDIVDCLLGHDAWTTRQVLLRCHELTDEQLDRPFDIGLGALRPTLVHIVWNMQAWTDVLAGRPVRVAPGSPTDAAWVSSLMERLDTATVDLAAVARRIRDEGRLDEIWQDGTGGPPAVGTRGGVIVHVATHGMHHRAEALHMLARLGVADLIEGDALSWEQQFRRAVAVGIT